MKQKCTFIFLFLQIAGLSAFAQTTLTYQTHGANVGDVITLKALEGANPGSAGEYQVWDYSGAVVSDNQNTIHYNADPSASKKATGKSFACSQEENTTVYLNVNPTAKLYYGLQTDNAKIEFEEPIKELVFPFQYQSQISGKMKGTYTDFATGEVGPIDGEYSIVGDAWGTLILPNGVTLKDVLRVKYVKKYDQMHAGTMFHITVNSYLFYTADSRYAVLQIKESEIDCRCGCSSKELKAYYNDSVVPNAGITIKDNNKQNSKESELLAINPFTYTLYPNPFEKELRLDYSITANAAKIKVNVLDLGGKKLKTLVNDKQKRGDYAVSSDLGYLSEGTYILQIQVDDVVYTEKVIKKNR